MKWEKWRNGETISITAATTLANETLLCGGLAVERKPPRNRVFFHSFSVSQTMARDGEKRNEEEELLKRNEEEALLSDVVMTSGGEEASCVARASEVQQWGLASRSKQ
jgi:hypothetical protein